MKNHSLSLLILFALPLASVVSIEAANEFHVCKTGGANFTTIQAAVDAAQPGDVIKVAAATYTEAKLVSGTQYNLYVDKTVRILGGYTCADFNNQNSSANVTTIRPFTSAQSVVSINGVSGATSTVAPMINGFTITGGGGGNHGGGISIRDSDAIISNNIITGNTGYLLGGGIYVAGGDPRIRYNRIQNNIADGQGNFAYGGGIEIESAKGAVVSNIIANNTLTNAPTTDGGGIDVSSGGPVVVGNNTIVGNTKNGVHAGADVTFFNNIISTHPVGVSATGTATVTSSYNIFFGNTANAQGFALGAADQTVDPQLTADYHLNAGSPAIDAGTHANAPNRDIDRQPRAMIGTSGLYKIDIGADEFTGAPQRMVNVDQEAADLTIIGPGGIIGHPDPTANNWMGYSVMGADITGDGRADLIMSAQDWAEDFNSLNATGRVFGLNHFGVRTLGTIDLYTRPADLTVVSKFEYQHIGEAFASGDLNGDGKRDLIIGASDSDGTTKSFPNVYVYFGGPSLTGTRTLATGSPANFTLRAPAPDYLAYSTRNALASGDISGDGIDDLLVGDSLANDGSTPATGAVFGVFGNPSLSGLFDLGTTAANLAVYGPTANANLGKFALGRLNNDGQLDLAARTDTAAYVLFGPRSGAIHLSTTPADVTITGLAAGGIAIMDFNGDGINDLILGSGSNIYIVPGPFTSGQSFNVAARASLTLTGISATAFAVADVVGDSKPDLLVGAPGDSRALVIPGGTTTTGSVATEDVASLLARENGFVVNDLGFDVAGGDLDGDGKADLIIGSRFTDTNTHPPGFERGGKVFVFYGTAPPVPTQVVSRKLHNGVAFDINLPLTGNIGVECRNGGATGNYQVLFTFPTAVTFSSATVTSGAGSVTTSPGSGTTTATVNLTGVTNAQRITVTLHAVNNLGDVSVPMGVLLGDANGDRSVNAADATITRNRSGQPANATNFSSDYNVDGSINSADATIVRARSGQFIP